jgi:hypothetical protein
MFAISAPTVQWVGHAYRLLDLLIRTRCISQSKGGPMIRLAMLGILILAIVWAVLGFWR